MNAMEMSNEGYLLLLHVNESWRELGREELEKYISQNNAWLEHLMTSGKAKGGQALARSGAIVSGKNGRNVTDGPFAESKEVVGGYLMLNVETFEEAVAIAKSCPMLAFGGKAEVRPLTNVCASHIRLEEMRREPQLAVA
ncbi:MAG TPA: YciI family protein [Candidatus Saccharimonadales bacterium]|nr:YciI family protein [Candidatus Saccharimonadales bacterium]